MSDQRDLNKNFLGQINCQQSAMAGLYLNCGHLKKLSGKLT